MFEKISYKHSFTDALVDDDALVIRLADLENTSNLSAGSLLYLSADGTSLAPKDDGHQMLYGLLLEAVEPTAKSARVLVSGKARNIWGKIASEVLLLDCAGVHLY